MYKTIIVALTFFVISFPSVIFSGENVEIPTSVRAKKAISKVTPKLTAELTKRNLKLGSPIFIRIFKEENLLEMWVVQKGHYKLFKVYPICTYGSQGLGPKLRQGDGRAPEGFYFIKPSSLNPYSSFYLSFNIGYPNQYDRIHGRTGSALMVHGNCASIGCYAMTNSWIEEIYTLADAALRNGQIFFRVHIFPFKMSDKNMKKHNESDWYSFWKNLKEGYDYFETNGNIPPNVEVKNYRYIFSDL